MENPAVANAKWWVDFWETVEHWAFLGVVLTLAIEFAAAHFLKSPRKAVDDARQIEVATLTKEAEEARSAIEDAKARALEAQVALEQFKAPRSLDRSQQEKVTAAIAAFPKTPFDFAIQVDPEPIALMEKISAALTTAKWERQKWGDGVGVVFTMPGELSAGIVSFQGLEIQIAESRKGDLEAPATALWHALESTGIVVAAKRIPDEQGVKPNAIHILIGTKPQ